MREWETAVFRDCGEDEGLRGFVGRRPITSAQLAPDVVGDTIRVFESGAVTWVQISVASCFSGDWFCFQACEPIITVEARKKANRVPRTVIRMRGGNEIFSGTIAGSRTLTVGISLASWIFAISYSCTRSSYTVSWILFSR